MKHLQFFTFLVIFWKREVYRFRYPSIIHRMRQMNAPRDCVSSWGQHPAINLTTCFKPPPLFQFRNLRKPALSNRRTEMSGMYRSTLTYGTCKWNQNQWKCLCTSETCKANTTTSRTAWREVSVSSKMSNNVSKMRYPRDQFLQYVVCILFHLNLVEKEILTKSADHWSKTSSVSHCPNWCSISLMPSSSPQAHNSTSRVLDQPGTLRFAIVHTCRHRNQ